MWYDNFGSILSNKDFDYSKDKALFMQMPTGAVNLVGCILLAYSIRFIPFRMLLASFGTALTVMAQCLLAFAQGNRARSGDYFLYLFGPIGFISLLSVVVSNVAAYTKKVTTNVIYLIGYCTGNWIGPQTFIASQALKYAAIKIAIVFCGSFSLVCLLTIWYAYWVGIKHRDSLPIVEYIENQEFADLTDKEIPNFKYSI